MMTGDGPNIEQRFRYLDCTLAFASKSRPYETCGVKGVCNSPALPAVEVDTLII